MIHTIDVIKLNEPILTAIQKYDSKLFFKWNGEKNFFELWRKMPWGDRLITPVVKSIYDQSEECEFTTVDNRILPWLYSADSARASRNWMWVNRNRYNAAKEQRLKNYHTTNKNIAKDTYNAIHKDLLHVSANLGGASEFLKPDVKSLGRSCFRSQENMKKYLGEE